MTIQGFPLVKSAGFASRGQQSKSRVDQLLKTESRDCANEVKKLSSDKVRELGNFQFRRDNVSIGLEAWCRMIASKYRNVSK